MTPDVPDQPTLSNDSWILSGASSYYDLRGYYFLAPNLTKNETLGVLFEHLHPNEGKFELELGVVLPDLFPNLQGKPEYSLSVELDKTPRNVCFSNVMSRLRFQKDEQLLHALIHRSKLPTVRNGEINFIPADASVELLRTFATIRYEIDGSNAEEAFETHCESCIHDLIERLNHILKIMPFVDTSAGRVYSVAYSRASLPYFYFMLKGQSDNDFGHGWISPHVGRSLLNPSDLTPEKGKELHQYLDGTKMVDDIDAILHSAQTFMDGGVLDYTLLLCVIAAEVATQRYVYDRLHEESVSRTKLANAKGDMTYSLMLNIILFSIAPEDQKPDPDLIGIINRARSLRNLYMHEGEILNDPNEISAIFSATATFIEYVRQLKDNTGSCSPATASQGDHEGNESHEYVRPYALQEEQSVSNKHITSRLEHMEAAVEHLNQAHLFDFAERVTQHAEAIKGEVMLDVVNKLDRVQNEIRELRSEVYKLREP